MRTPPYPTQSYLKKRTMKPFRAALFALIVLLSAACSRPASDIVESSTNGLSGVRMPVQVTLREGVELAEDDLEDAVSFTPSADVEVYRLGVRTEGGLYVYYAHLSGYAEGIEEGVPVKAGQLLGFMGDTGYSKVEGTTGNFAVHLHLGLYMETDHYGELSLNPYGVLKYLENKKLRYDYEK